MSQLDESLAALRRRADAARELLNETANCSKEHEDSDVANDESGAPLRWVVRCTWQVVRGLPHPKHTYTRRDTESAAIDYAVQMLDNYDSAGSLRLLEVHVKGPDQDLWMRVQ